MREKSPIREAVGHPQDAFGSGGGLEALREAVLRYRTVADFTYDWVYWETPESTFHYVSPSCERITGYAAEEFLANPSLLHELILPEDREAWHQHRQAVRTLDQREIELRVRHRNGETRWIEHACQRVIDESGAFLGYRVSNRDVTGRKRVEEELIAYREHLEDVVAERTAALAAANAALTREIADREHVEVALRRSDERYALAQRAAGIGSWDWDIRTGDLYWSDQIEPMFGFEPGQFGATYEAFLERVHPEDRQRVMEAVDASVEEGADYAIEHRIVWPDGTVRWVSEVGDVVLDQAGLPVRMLGVVQDITGRWRAEDALRESEEKFRTVAEQSPNMIFITRRGRIVYANRKCEEMMGHTREEFYAPDFDFQCLIAPEDRVRIGRQLSALSRGQDIPPCEYGLVTQQGERIDAILASTPIRYRGESAVLGTVTDITERKSVEKALLEAKEAAEAARREEQARRLEADQRRRIAEALRGVLAVLNSNRPLNEVLDYIAAQAGDLLGTRAAGIYRLEEGGRLSVQALRGLLATYAAGASIPIGHGALQQAMASRQPVAVPDIDSAAARSSGLVMSEQHGTAVQAWTRFYRALLAIPIITQGELYGGMLLYYGKPRPFSDEEIELAVAFADQVALAIGNAWLREQVGQAATAAERDRLARDLHDAVTQTLFSASLIAEAMPRIWERDPEEGRRGLEELRRLTRGAAAEMRTMLVELRPAALTEKPLGELLRHLTEAVTGRARVPIELTVDGDSILPADVQIALYRTAQEALNNITKHAGASLVSITLSCRPREALLRISDDGCGFDPDVILPDRFGLSIMRERAQTIGAVLEIDGKPGHGTRITVDWKAQRRE